MAEKQNEEVVETEERLYAGKFKAPEDVEAGYLESEKKMKEQSEELGTQKRQNQALLDQIESMKVTAPKSSDADAPDFAAQQALVHQQIEDGDLTLAEGLAKSSEITASIAAAAAAEKFEQARQEETIATSQAQFAKDNPDFIEARDSGVLEGIKSSLPGLHDDFSAYFALKAQKEAEASFLKGKEEGMKVASGDENTRTVLPGEDTGQESMKEVGKDNQPKTTADIIAGMTDALQQYRESG